MYPQSVLWRNNDDGAVVQRRSVCDCRRSDDSVHELGWGFLEAVYQEALEIELSERGIPITAQKELRIIYKGRPLKKTYNGDLLCYGKIMVELKSEERLMNKDRGQLPRNPITTTPLPMV